MRSLMVIIDGLGDDPIDAFGGRTPFEYARHPNIDKLLKKGSYSEISICGSDFPAESLGCILRLLGVEQKDFPLNRAYLELLANGRDISEYEMVLRCNLLTEPESCFPLTQWGLQQKKWQKLPPYAISCGRELSFCIFPSTAIY